MPAAKSSPASPLPASDSSSDCGGAKEIPQRETAGCCSPENHQVCLVVSRLNFTCKCAISVSFSVLFRDLFFCGSMLFLMLCINQNNSLTDQHRLSNTIRKQIIR